MRVRVRVSELVRVYVCVCVRLSVRVHVHVCMCTCVCVRACVHVQVCLHLCVRVCVYLHVHACACQVLPAMEEQGYGKIVNIGTNLVYNPVVTYYDYTASKAVLMYVCILVYTCMYFIHIYIQI